MRIEMKQRYRVFRRGWGTYYVEDIETKKQESLHTCDKAEAYRLVDARNETDTAIKDRAFAPLRQLPVVETKAEHFLRVLAVGTVSTNVYLRRLHNFALDMGWLPWPVIPKKQWPAVRYQSKRAITHDEQRAIIAREGNEERRAFYELAWHLGASQTDISRTSPAPTT